MSATQSIQQRILNTTPQTIDKSFAEAEMDGHKYTVYVNKDQFVDSGWKKEEGQEHCKRKNAWDMTVSYFSTANGVFRLFQFFDRVSRAVMDILEKVGKLQTKAYDFFQAASSKSFLVWTMLSIPRLPEVWKSAYKSISDASEKTKSTEIAGASGRKVMEAINKISDALAMTFYSISLVTGNLLYKTIADVPDFVHNVAETQMEGEDYLITRAAARRAEALNVTPEVKDALVHAQTNHLIKMFKSGSSATGYAFTVLGSWTGPILPSLAQIGLSLSSTVCAMWAGFHEQSGPFEIVKPFSTRHVERVVVPATA